MLSNIAWKGIFILMGFIIHNELNHQSELNELSHWNFIKVVDIIKTAPSLVHLGLVKIQYDIKKYIWYCHENVGASCWDH